MDEAPDASTLLRRLTADSIDMNAVSRCLDDASDAQRARALLALGRSHLARLFAAAEGHHPLELAHFVPSTQAALEGVTHLGKNSLPVFKSFAKVFCRPDESAADELWGYNRNPGLVATFVGPGYFRLRRSDAPGELVIDYAVLPPRRPPSWPDIVPNDRGLSRFVYHGTTDVLRGISSHFSIGRVHRRGQPMNAWFALCRAAD